MSVKYVGKAMKKKFHSLVKGKRIRKEVKKVNGEKWQFWGSENGFFSVVCFKEIKKNSLAHSSVLTVFFVGTSRTNTAILSRISIIAMAVIGPKNEKGLSVLISRLNYYLCEEYKQSGRWKFFSKLEISCSFLYIF